MKNVLKKVVKGVLAISLALLVAGCSNGSEQDVKETVATPAFSVVSGVVNSGTKVTISCETEDAVIRYTTDGTDPTATTGTVYTTPVSITQAVIIKAIAVKDGMNDSEVATAFYRIKWTTVTPFFFETPGGVVISSTTAGATIRYTTDGTDPTATTGTVYSSPITVNPPMTIKAIAVKDGMNDSAVAVYIVKPDYSTCKARDYILKDGSILEYSDDLTLTDEQKASIAAIICRPVEERSDAPVLGVGLIQSEATLAWCTDAAAGNNVSISDLKNITDGSSSWEIIKAATGETDADISKYPAFEYCYKYAEGKGFSEYMADGWYLPSETELWALIKFNKSAVNKSLEKAGYISLKIRTPYWSCTQADDSDKAIYLTDQSPYGNPKEKNSTYDVCAVRVFE